MRVYLPATLGSVAQLLADGSLTVDHATASTADLRAALSQTTDEEDLELEALLDAAELSVGLLERDPSVPRRRVVLAADVPDGTVRPAVDVPDGSGGSAPEAGPAVVRLTAAVQLAWVVSAHVDEAAAETRVAAGDTEDLDLLWYAASELPDLLPDAVPPPTHS